MSNVPEGAQVSEDGQWWWDGQAWQPVEQDSAPADDSGGGGAEGGEASGDREAARVAQGLPAALADVTDDQRKQYIGEPTITVEVEAAEEVEVLAMSDVDDGSGEAIA